MTKLGKLIILVIITAAIVGTLAYTGNLDLEKLNFKKLTQTVDTAPEESIETEEVIELYGELVYAYGEVYKSNDGAWKKIETGEIISEGDSIKTNSDSRATILFDDGSAIRLSASSEIEIEKIQTEEILIMEKSGSTYSRVAKIDNRDYSVHSGDVKTTALGTAFIVAVENEQVSVKVFESKVKVSYDESNREIDAGEELKINTGSKEVSKEDMEVTTIMEDEFVKWNKEEDEKNNFDTGVLKADDDEESEEDEEENPNEEEKTAENSNQTNHAINLSVNGTKATWSTSLAAEKGFKLVWSPNPGPTYPLRELDKYMYYKDSFVREGDLDAFNGTGNYYVRVCEYLGGKCGTYSNEVKVYLEKKSSKKENTSSGVSSISLSVNGTSASWSVNGYSENGYKLVWSKNSKPTYPTRSGDKYAYYSNPSTKSGQINLFDGPGTYYVRVCEYLGGKCGVYSNQVTVELGSSGTSEAVNSISLNVSGNTASWSVDGYSAKGYKLVWSKNSEPTYPTRSGDKYSYLSNPNTTSAGLHAFDGSGTYYVRVCEYLGGACGVYSNQITVELN